MPATPDLTVPADLLPADGRFGCGPSRVRVEALEALAATGADLLGTSHRKDRVRDQVARLRRGIAEVFDLPDGYEVLLAMGGATAFWDAATFGLVRGRARHYVFGEFSGKFAAVTAEAPFLADPDVVESRIGTAPTVTPAPDDVDVQALTHNETSTGVMMDPVRADDALVLVDATSGAGGLPVDLSQVDAYYFSLQKGFAAEGGLTVVIASPALLERIDELAGGDRWIPPFLRLSTAVTNSRKEQTYNTPSVSTIFLAAEQTDWLAGRGGLDAVVADQRDKAAIVYDWAGERDWASPFVTDVSERSLVVATIDLDDAIDADLVNDVLRANGVLDTDGYRKLGRNQLRVGMFPAVPASDLQAYVATVDWIVDHL
ncbi:phosphoserine transaminase [Salsipaludibacter albus]|uniref:phosphoserine transaminase n=1 Tax=Salsipaludibacter albus TaxID=2849650 RepID=UPI001EE3CF41|nr:phosphoserine transaminase [Salsipaludibacter albus]MBY5161625.1 phosphoserine transaminase [Salsipaludibacter albus]